MTGESGETFRMEGMVLKDLGMQVLGKRSEYIGPDHESQAKIEKRSSIGRRPFPSRLAELPRDASMRASLVFTSR